MVKIIVSEFAEENISDAFVWYENAQPSLGYRFLSELEKAFGQLQSFPKKFSYIDDDKVFRDYCMPKFPFLIIYIVSEDEVRIISVHHAKKHPSKRYGR